MKCIVSLVEKAAAEVSGADVSVMTKNMSDATFDLNDFINQSELITKFCRCRQYDFRHWWLN